jgi:BirA family biotin operon repressor/biotin-[acetyl-CoA-carboxylase] ligase
VCGLATADAIRAASGRHAAIKWPNDVLLDGRKVAGILTEMESELERVHHVIAGIGVNLNMPARAVPRALRTKAGSLFSLTGRRVDRAAFTAGLLAALEARYGRFLTEGFASSVRAELESLSSLTGTEVRVAAPGGETTGRVIGLDADGALRVRRAGGDEVRIVAGEVTVVGGYQNA